MQLRNAERRKSGEAEIGEFLRGSEGTEFTGQGWAEIYEWTRRVLVAQE